MESTQRPLHDDYNLQFSCSCPVGILFIPARICVLKNRFRGWDQTGSNGANLSFPEVFNIAQKPGDPNNTRNDWIVGVINAA